MKIFFRILTLLSVIGWGMSFYYSAPFLMMFFLCSSYVFYYASICDIKINITHKKNI